MLPLALSLQLHWCDLEAFLITIPIIWKDWLSPIYLLHSIQVSGHESPSPKGYSLTTYLK
jgi:hypothetical protein